MRKKTYTAQEFASIIGISKAELLKKEKAGAIPQAKRNKKTNHRYFVPGDIAVYRKKLGKPPLLEGRRKQLFLNFKGGTGKSSISASYAYRLAELGLNVLAVDLDPQGHLTKCLGYDGSKYETTLFNVLIDKEDITKAIIRTQILTLDLIPSNLMVSPIELSLVSLNAREFRLKRALETIEDEYDIIVMDAPPNIGLLNLNAILASDDMLVPVLADFLAYHGLKILFETVYTIEEDFNFQFDNIYIILNRYNASHGICLQAKDALEKHYSKYLVKTIIRQNTQIADATAEGEPIFQHAPSSRGAKDIATLVNEVFGF